MQTIELTKKQAKDFKNAAGMYGFAIATKFKKQARAKADETNDSCQLTCKGEVLYVAHKTEGADENG